MCKVMMLWWASRIIVYFMPCNICFNLWTKSFWNLGYDVPNFNFRSMFSAADMRRSRKFSRGGGGGRGGGLALDHGGSDSLPFQNPYPNPPTLDPCMADVLLKHFQSPVGLVLNINVGSFKPCSHRRCNRLATVSRLRKVKIAEFARSQKGFAEVVDQSPTSRRPAAEYVQPESVASCLLNIHKRRAATDFGRMEVSVVAKRSPTSRRCDWSATDWRLKGNGDLSSTDRWPIGDLSPTSPVDD